MNGVLQRIVLGPVGLFSLERKRLRVVPIDVYRYLMVRSKEEGDRLFPVVPSDGKRGNGHKVTYRKFHLNAAKPLFYG